jgi:MFS transporter, DHA1 family, multidrug resistance protein
MLLVTLIYSFAWALYIYAYQPFAVEKLGMSVQQIAQMFTLFGIIGLVTQGFILPKVSRKWKEKQMLIWSLGLVVASFVAMYFVTTITVWVIVASIMSLANVFVAPMIQSILSKEADVVSQGSILGLNASYASLGMIFGPIVGGFISTWSLPGPFLLGGVTTAIGLLVTLQILKTPLRKQHAF